MLRKLNTKKSGFTLVEIMIVVAIIALLATIAVPNFLRARKRSQATTILEELRVIDGAKDTWAIENNKAGDADAPWLSLTPHFKPGTRLATLTTPTDLLENAITITTVDKAPQIHADTYENFKDVFADETAAKSFWGAFYGAAADDEG